MDVFTASLLSACSLRRGHFVNNLMSLFFSYGESPLRYSLLLYVHSAV
ncbi:gluconate 5-dehydrogenase [Yersinia similis]